MVSYHHCLAHLVMFHVDDPVRNSLIAIQEVAFLVTGWRERIGRWTTVGIPCILFNGQ